MDLAYYIGFWAALISLISISLMVVLGIIWAEFFEVESYQIIKTLDAGFGAAFVCMGLTLLIGLGTLTTTYIIDFFI